MIEFNLLPTVKMDYIKAQRSRRLMFTISALVTMAAVVLLGFMLAYQGFQKKHLNDVNADIAAETSQLKHKPQIDKILTVQNQLQSLTALHAAKPAASNLFNYLNDVTPAKVSISHFSADFTTQSVTVSGGTDALSTVNQYVDTLKFTKYTTDDDTTQTPAFTNVVLNSFGLSATTSSGSNPASYSISFNYDPNIFDVTKQVKLTVPKVTTTRSAINSPTDLFQAGSGTTKGSN